MVKCSNWTFEAYIEMGIFIASMDTTNIFLRGAVGGDGWFGARYFVFQGRGSPLGETVKMEGAILNFVNLRYDTVHRLEV